MHVEYLLGISLAFLAIAIFSGTKSRRSGGERDGLRVPYESTGKKNTTRDHDPEVVVVNAGIAGCAVAYALGKVPKKLSEVLVAGIAKGNMRTTPIRSMPADPYPTPGALLMGDAFNTRHPLTAGGMTVAFSDIAVLANLLKPLKNFDDARALCKYLESFYILRKVPKKLSEVLIAAIAKGMRMMPIRSMPADPYPTPGALLMGDAFNMRHPLTAGGMTVAFSDIVVLANLLKPLKNFDDARALCKYLESFYILRKPLSPTINTLANALYKVLGSSPDLAMEEMRQACFEYLSLGGVFSMGPIALLSGLKPRPLILILHFFAVTVYGVGRLLVPFPSPRRLWMSARLILGASKIIFPILKAEGVRQMFFPNTVLAFYRTPPNNGFDKF